MTKKSIFTMVLFIVSILFFQVDIFAYTPRLQSPREQPPVNGAYYSKPLNPFGEYGGNCTWYAYGRAYELLGTKPNLSWGNAGDWWQTNIQRGAYPYGQEPKLGAIGCWNYGGDYGHVAVVEKIENGVVYFSNSSYDKPKYYFQVNNFNYFRRNAFQGYIYILNDPAPAQLTSSPEVINGEYIITTQLNRDMALQVDYDNRDNGANVTIGSYTAGPRQRWKLVKNEDGTFQILSKLTNKALDVEGSYSGDRINIQTWDYVGGDNQKWYIVHCGDGWYKFIAKHSGYVMDVSGPGNTENTNIWQFQWNNSAAQKFRLNAYTPPLKEPLPQESASEIVDGNYIIRSQLDPKMVVQFDIHNIYNGSNVTIGEYRELENQIWRLHKNQDGTFRITSYLTNRAIDVQGIQYGNEVNIHTWEYGGGENQKWYIVNCGDGLYKFVAKHSGYVMDVKWGRDIATSNIWQYKWNNSNAQKFRLEHIPLKSSPETSTETSPKTSLKTSQESLVKEDNIHSQIENNVNVSQEPEKEDWNQMSLTTTFKIGTQEMILSENEIKRRIIMDTSAFISEGRTMIPIRYVAEALGFNVDWIASTQTVVLQDSEYRIEIPVHTNKIIVNGKVVLSDVLPVIRNNRTHISISNIGKALGLERGKEIFWNEKTKEVTIKRTLKKP